MPHIPMLSPLPTRGLSLAGIIQSRSPAKIISGRKEEVFTNIDGGQSVKSRDKEAR